MVDRESFEGGLTYGPATFVKLTGRDRVWAAKPIDIILSQERSCPVCGAGGSEKRKLLFYADRAVSDKNLWDYHRCLICGMIYTVFAPTEEAMGAVYKKAPAQQEWVSLQQNRTEFDVDSLKFKWALEWAGWADCEKRILDIGCSTGTLLSVAGGMIPAETNNAMLAGVEINHGALAVAAANLDFPGVAVVTGANLELMKYVAVGGEPKKFGMVVLWEVLEHVLDPKAMLKEATDLLAPGGTILICVPNVNSLAAQILHEKAPMFGLGHLNMFDTHGLVSLLPEFTGFCFTSIISWRKELINWSNLLGPFGADPDDSGAPLWLPSAVEILDRLRGYKLVLTAKKGRKA